MTSLGAYLKSRREEKGLSLQKIQEDTKIRLKYLEAIEADRLEILPGEVYIRGFLKTYASVVGLNEDEVIARYEKAFLSHGQDADGAANEPTIITTTEISDMYEKKSLFQTNTRFYFYCVGVTIVLALIFVPLLLSKRNDDSIRAVDMPAEGIAGEENVVISDDGNVNPEPDVDVAELKTIALSVYSECWVDVRIDGAIVEQRTLQPGERPQWSGRKVQIILGNAGGVTLFKDGKNMGIPGEISQRLELEFAVDGD